MSTTSDSERLVELESRVAFQDDLIESLNEIVARQDREILLLSKRVADLESKVEDIAAAAPAAGDGHEPPPHY